MSEHNSKTSINANGDIIVEMEDRKDKPAIYVDSENEETETEEMEDDRSAAPIDRGWAWVVLGACVFEIVIYGGIMRSFGVFFLQYQMRFNSSASETSIMNLIQNLVLSTSEQELSLTSDTCPRKRCPTVFVLSMCSIIVFPKIVKLNVGGKILATQLSTLTKEIGSKLAAMFDGSKEMEKDEDGYFFIDFDGEVFLHILNFLREGTLPPAEMILSVYSLATNLNITSLVTVLRNNHHVQYRIRIGDLKESVARYDKLKEDVIKQINDSNDGPAENKLLLIFRRPPRSCSECKVGEFGLSQCKNIYPRFIVPTERDFDITNGLKILIYDLCEMGFCKYIDSRIISENCSNCGEIEFHEIALLSR